MKLETLFFLFSCIVVFAVESSNQSVGKENSPINEKFIFFSFWDDIGKVGQAKIRQFLPYRRRDDLFLGQAPRITTGLFGKIMRQEECELASEEVTFLVKLIKARIPIQYLNIFNHPSTSIMLSKEDYESGCWKEQFQEGELVEQVLNRFLPEEMKLDFLNEILALDCDILNEIMKGILKSRSLNTKTFQLKGIMTLCKLVDFAIPIKLIISSAASLEELLGIQWNVEISNSGSSQDSCSSEEEQLFKSWNTYDLISSSNEKTNLLTALSRNLFKASMNPSRLISQNWDSFLLWKSPRISSGTFGVISLSGFGLSLDWQGLAECISLENEEENLAFCKFLLGQPEDWNKLFGQVMSPELSVIIRKRPGLLAYLRRSLFSRLIE